jgi:short-subunit dehydrogenase
MPKRAVYAATKAFLLTFIRVLAAELQDSGVRLQVVCPGMVRTEFHTRQDMDMSARPRLEPEQVVQASLAALERGEVVCIPAMEDVELLQRHDQADVELLGAGMAAVLATRYSR